MNGATFDALRLTLLVASVATVVVVVPGTLLAYVLARHSFRGKTLVSALVGLPLVLPPTAVGFLLLSLFGADGWLGARRMGFDLGLLLTWKGAVLASAIMATPLVVRTARVAFEGVDPRLEAMSRTLGHGRVATFAGTTLPLAARGLTAATILGFTRAVGEFGATVIVAGNIPGRTQTLASALYTAQQVGDHGQAKVLLAIALVLGIGSIVVAEYLVQHPRRGRGTNP